MVMQSLASNGVLENPTIEISHEGLRSILNEIEAELLDSEVYRRTMAGLQTMLGEASNTAQILVKAVGREAVRLTFQQVVKQYNVIPVASNEVSHTRQEVVDSLQMVGDNLVVVPQSSTTSTEEVNHSVETTKSFVGNRLIGETKPPKKLSKSELSAQAIAKERQERLRQIGKELWQAREARSISVDQLYRQTLVPLHHIEALEAGRLEQLPEDVYIRGFIRRMGHALGLNGVAIAASLPEPDPVKSVVPSWYNSTAVPGFHLNSVHLYLGYTALIAGAVGGLSLMSKQATSGVSTAPESVTPSHTSASPKNQPAQNTSKPGLQASKAGIKAGADIAPPEASRF